RSGIANANGIRPSEPFTFKSGYLVGLICLVPLIGAFAGIVLIILGLVHYKDKVFVIMGAIGITITVVLYGSLFYASQNTDVFKSGFADITQTQINDLVKSIEFYKMQNGSYPDSLQQVENKGSFISIYDTMSEMKVGSKAITYQYHKVGNKYILFSVGIDGKANTRDDIYPTLSVVDTSKLGFVRKKIY
ncbi:MAG: type II secretion system protein GspG, partial [Mucilaginibacter sp.]